MDQEKQSNEIPEFEVTRDRDQKHRGSQRTDADRANDRERQRKSRANRAAAATTAAWSPTSTDVPSDREAVEILEERIQNDHVRKVVLEQGKLAADRLQIAANRHYWRFGLQHNLTCRVAKKHLPILEGEVVDVCGLLHNGQKFPFAVLIESDGEQFVSEYPQTFVPTQGMLVTFAADSDEHRALDMKRVLSREESLAERDRIIADYVAKRAKPEVTGVNAGGHDETIDVQPESSTT